MAGSFWASLISKPGRSLVTVSLFALLTLPFPAEAAQKRKKQPYSPPSAELVMDYHSGQVLYSRNADAERHPASLTKVMTLYMLFEEMKAGRLSLDSKIRVSARAAGQAPSRLGVKAGEKLRVEDAILALVTKSANDVACAVAEHLGGTEAEFARRMTQRAHQIGMTRSNFKNASGLPNKQQITTARDMATLAKRIQIDFPQYYHYFSAKEFVWKGDRFKSHNHLLGKYVGTTGLKTGYTAASGFNLTATVQRDGKALIGVVLGGKSVKARDKQMVAILDRTMPQALALRDTGLRVASAQNLPAAISAPAPQISSEDRMALAALTDTDETDPDEETYQASAPQPVAAKAPVAVAALAPVAVTASVKREDAALPAAAAVTAPAPTPTKTAAIAAERTKPVVLPQQSPLRVASAAPAPEASSKSALAPASGVLPTPGATAHNAQASVERATAYAVQAGRDLGNLIITPAHASEGTQPTAALPAAAPQSQSVWAMGDPLIPAGTWVIQIGAYASQGDAVERIRHAIKTAPEALNKAIPVTIPVKTAENKTLYRSRFGGFIGEKDARNACGRLARENISCIAIPPANWSLPKAASDSSAKKGRAS